MRTSRKVVLGCAVTGFIVPLLMLVYYNITSTGAGLLFVTLCPVCIASIALDDASRMTAIFSWLIFCCVNATLYSIPALLVVMVLSFRRRT